MRRLLLGGHLAVVLCVLAAPAAAEEAKSLDRLLRELMDPETAVRVAAADALGGCAEKEPAAKPLEEALSDPRSEVRLAAARALGRLGEAADFAALTLYRVARGDADEAVRAEAVSTLAALGAVASFLFPRVEPPRAVVLEDLRVLIRRLEGRAIPALAQLLQNESWYVRALALEEAERLRGAARRLVPAIRARLEDRAPAVRNLAALAIRSIGADEATLDALADRLADDHPFVRMAAATALAAAGEPDDVRCAHLARAATSEEAAIRYVAIRGLRTRGKGGLDVFRRALSDEDGRVVLDAALALVARGERDEKIARRLGAAFPRGVPLRHFAFPGRSGRRGLRARRMWVPGGPAAPRHTEVAEAMVALGPFAVPELEKILRSGGYVARLNAVWALARIPGGTTDLVVGRLSDEYEDVRLIAALTLLDRETHPEEVARVLVAVVVGGETRHADDASRIAADALIRLGAAAVPALVRALPAPAPEKEDDGQPSITMIEPATEAVRAVIRRLGETARPALEALTRGDDPDLRVRAAAALELLK